MGDAWRTINLTIGNLGNVGVPIKLLFEAEGMKVSVEVSAFSIVAFVSLIDLINN